VPDHLEDHLGTAAAGQLADRRHGVGLRRVDRVGGAELARPAELALVEVDRDDPLGAGHGAGGDRRVADPTAAEHGHAVARLHAGGAQGGAVAGRHTAADQAGRLRADARVDLDRLRGGDQGQLGEPADPQRRRQRGAVGQLHPLARLLAGGALPRVAAPAAPAPSARRPPGEHHEVARLEARDAVADRLDAAGDLVAEQEGELPVHDPVAVEQVGVADAARPHPHPAPRRVPGRAPPRSRPRRSRPWNQRRLP